tara:strand:- start:596 stop:745 length:150 start_codon:yes stop_codon:yes gene_type:complete
VTTKLGKTGFQRCHRSKFFGKYYDRFSFKNFFPGFEKNWAQKNDFEKSM